MNSKQQEQIREELFEIFSGNNNFLDAVALQCISASLEGRNFKNTSEAIEYTCNKLCRDGTRYPSETAHGIASQIESRMSKFNQLKSKA